MHVLKVPWPIQALQNCLYSIFCHISMSLKGTGTTWKEQMHKMYQLLINTHRLIAHSPSET